MVACVVQRLVVIVWSFVISCACLCVVHYRTCACSGYVRVACGCMDRGVGLSFVLLFAPVGRSPLANDGGVMHGVGRYPGVGLERSYF